MNGTIFAFSIDPFLCCLVVRAFVDLARLAAHADDLAILFVMSDFQRWAAASGSQAECGQMSVGTNMALR